jgi:anti-sigma regulatory factor (Ser/Thr protein kinase)/anti-anti-sigma regulatory factor
VNQPLRFGSGPLSVQVMELPPYVVAQWIGTGLEVVRETALQAAGEILARPSERVVLDLGRFSEASDAVLHVLSRTISEAQRQGRNISLVRCNSDLFRHLQRAGVNGAIAHAGSLLAATQGLVGDPASTLDLHLQSTPELLHRLRSVITALAQEAHMPESTELQLKTAVTEAAANAIVHGSPEGPRNHVHVSFHLDQGMLIVDVADQGPGFDPCHVSAPVAADLREHGYGLFMMTESVDRVEFYRDDRGMLVRMTKFLEAPGRGWVQ